MYSFRVPSPARAVRQAPGTDGRTEPADTAEEEKALMTHTRIVGLALATALVLPAAAAAQYPSSQPVSKAAKAGKLSSRTLRVCRRGCAFHTIQSAVRAARAGNTIRVGNGVYHEGVKVVGKAKRRLRLIGNPKHRGRVVIEADHRVDNGVLINGADHVTLDGFTARDYTANGFFATNVVGYHYNHLDANHGGAYGLFAFNSKGGLMENSQASFNNDSGFYIGQTPRQKHPKRSLVRNVKAFANVLGWSGTNMRYVTITKSQWFNNGVGLVPNALDSEKFAPPEDNLIVDNDIFWNNFDYYQGAPFPIRPSSTRRPLPGRHRRPALRRPARQGDQQPHLRQLPGRRRGDQADPAHSAPDPEPRWQPGPRQQLRAQRHRPERARPVLRRQRHGQLLRAQHRRARDRSGQRVDADPVPVLGRQHVRPGGPERGVRLGRRPDARGQLDSPSARAAGGGHAARALHAVMGSARKIAIVAAGAVALAAAPAVAGSPTAAKPGRLKVAVADNYFGPAKVVVKPGTKVTWHWTDLARTIHDVKLVSAPKGVHRFHSPFGSVGFHYSKHLTKPGSYRFICTLHVGAGMQMRIIVRR